MGKKKRIVNFKKELFKLPNELTALRLILLPIILVTLLYHKLGWTFVCYMIAVITDFFDGYVARKTQQITVLGKILDPLADKLLSLIMYITLSIKALNFLNTVPVWLTVFIVSRDIIIVAGVFIIYVIKDDVIIDVNIWGKTTAVLQDFTIFLVLFFNLLGKYCLYLNVFYILTLIFTLVSGYRYIKIGLKLVRNDSKKKNER